MPGFQLSDWDDVGEIVERALENPASAREQLLRQACGHDADRLTRARRVLTAAEQAASFLDRPAADLAPALLADAGAASTGDETLTHVGVYRILGLIGRGGMGDVYLAERDDAEFQRRVAVKVVRAGLGRDLVARFVSERQVLASFDHPHIAQLHDGGVTPDGRPYLVMEYVDGKPLDVYANEHALSIEQRLDLFLQVCAAVDRAHRRLVVHRDLKPANILVTRDGQVKLLDFGVAKLLDPDTATSGSPVTRIGLRIMTPEYSSPEQFLGEPTTTATDIYSLGVILYELLAGRRPFADGVSDLASLERAVLAGDVPPPSSVSRDAATSRHLRGDLDNIALTALRREPDRRYGSVLALRDDLERHRSGLPVLARPMTVRYRTAKFVRRHAVAVTAATAAIAILIAGTVMYTIGLARARDDARRAATIAEAQTTRAEAARDFLVSLIRTADPTNQGLGADRSVNELLRTARDRVEKELADQPELQAEMGLAVARALDGLGDATAALELSERSIARWRSLNLPADLTFGLGLSALGQLRTATGDNQGGERAIREAIAVMESLPASPEIPRHVIAARTGLANAIARSGRELDAMAERKAILDARLRLLANPNDPALAVDWFNLGIGYLNLSRFADAERAIREADRLLTTADRGHPRLVFVWAGLAMATSAAGDLAAGESYERKVEQELATRYGNAPTHPLRGSVLIARSRRLQYINHPDALEAIRAAVSNDRRGGYNNLNDSLNQEGAILLLSGRFREAAASYRESLKIYALNRPDTDIRLRGTRIGEAISRWRATGDARGLDTAAAILQAMQKDAQQTTRQFAEGASWLAAALEPTAPERAVEWRRHAEESLAKLYPATHPWRTSLAGTRR